MAHPVWPSREQLVAGALKADIKGSLLCQCPMGCAEPCFPYRDPATGIVVGGVWVCVEHGVWRADEGCFRMSVTTPPNATGLVRFERNISRKPSS